MPLWFPLWTNKYVDLCWKRLRTLAQMRPDANLTPYPRLRSLLPPTWLSINIVTLPAKSPRRYASSTSWVVSTWWIIRGRVEVWKQNSRCWDADVRDTEPGKHS